MFPRNETMPGLSIELIKHLDTHVKPAIVTSADDIDDFSLGEKAGARRIVDMLKQWAIDAEKRNK